MHITITGMSLDGHPLKVPEGLSELLNRANALRIPDEVSSIDGYRREVVRTNGKLITILKKVEEVGKAV